MVHLIFVCKYRKKLLTKLGEPKVHQHAKRVCCNFWLEGERSESFQQIKLLMFDIAKENDFELIKTEVDQNHIHLLISYNPTQSILDIVRFLKQIFTYRIWRQEDNHLYLQKHFWKEKTFWSDGYFACSIGNVSKETIEKYIQSQG